MYLSNWSTGQVVRFDFPRNFTGYVDMGIGNLEQALCKYLSGVKAYVLTDEAVWSREVGERIASVLPDFSSANLRVVRGGEEVKSFKMWRSTLEWMHIAGMQRRDVLLVVGGGSLTDMGGFAAASYLRGIPYINVPTTLLAQADASVGGKVAINSPTAKNSVGAFYHPMAVVTDVTLLSTLKRREISAGLAECVKVSAAQPTVELFRYIASNAERLLSGDERALLNVVRSAIEEKLRHLAPDPFELDLSRVLNFGHTIGHAIETADRYKSWLHGEAVAVGMATACRVSVAMGLAERHIYQEFRQLFNDLRLPLEVPAEIARQVIANLDAIRSVRGGKLRYVVPVAIGHLTTLDEVDTSLLLAAMREQAIE